MKQVEKIFALMCHNRYKKQWWYPPDFMQQSNGDFFVGYEASARLSELADKYPDMVESVRHGKYMLRRIRWENRDQWIDQLPENLKEIEAKYDGSSRN